MVISEEKQRELQEIRGPFFLPIRVHARGMLSVVIP
jgi:hypothetical protein